MPTHKILIPLISFALVIACDPKSDMDDETDAPMKRERTEIDVDYGKSSRVDDLAQPMLNGSATMLPAYSHTAAAGASKELDCFVD